MYSEDPLPRYYVAGTDSAYVDMQNAISTLCQYCQSLPSDIYTSYTPEWYIQQKTESLGVNLNSVVILLPIICPLRDVIQVGIRM